MGYIPFNFRFIFNFIFMIQRTKIYRKDYIVATHLIKTTNLFFDLYEDKTIVTNIMSIVKNPESNSEKSQLILDGEYLKLISVTKNGYHTEYTLSDNYLILNDLEDEFTLNIKTEIYPDKNTHLTGLYRSSGLYCTHCEAHGFRRITYYLDRPDVISIFTTTITADKDKYPYLLSNGNLHSVEKLENNRHKYTWCDPFPKPCYLFALVAGNLFVASDKFITKNNKEIQLKVYVEHKDNYKTQYALSCLKRAMAWDEKRFNLECDLNTYMIVAVDHFNMGAMENKGLNIFNSQCVLVDYKTVTDDELIEIESIIGHEYFHNWTGNRVTCRDWFQLSLKEGLTVFRDQEFTADLHNRILKRIEDVQLLKEQQFLEDSGSMSHPVRPDFYLEMDNFYTLTVYEKGAELFRMMHTILGEDRFQKGMQLYIDRFDGKAATVDNFVNSLEDANNYDFKQFMLWFSQSGTPLLAIDTYYKDNTYNITIRQKLNNNNKPFYLPFSYALIDKNGLHIKEEVFIVKNLVEKITFNNIDQKPLLSTLRNFSSPVNIVTNQSIEEYLLLIQYDNDKFSKWNNLQIIWTKVILNRNFELLYRVLGILELILQKSDDLAFSAKLLQLPNENHFHQLVEVIDIQQIHNDIQFFIEKIARKLQNYFLDTYNNLEKKTNSAFSPYDVANRLLKNTCLFYLSYLPENINLCYEQYINSTVMTDKISAFKYILNHNNFYHKKVIDDFYNKFSNDELILDKWFRVQALSRLATTESIKKLLEHTKFSYFQPNRVRALLGAFSSNHKIFNCYEGYTLLKEAILHLNNINPQIGARLTSCFNHWYKYEIKTKLLQEQILKELLNTKDLSNNIYEIVNNALKY